MKKKIIGAFAVVAVAAVAALNINVNLNAEKGESTINLSNVEALADGENGGNTTCASGCSGAFCGTWIPASGPSVSLYYC